MLHIECTQTFLPVFYKLTDKTIFNNWLWKSTLTEANKLRLFWLTWVASVYGVLVEAGSIVIEGSSIMCELCHQVNVSPGHCRPSKVCVLLVCWPTDYWSCITLLTGVISTPRSMARCVLPAAAAPEPDAWSSHVAFPAYWRWVALWRTGFLLRR